LFKHIGITGKSHDQQLASLLERLWRHLQQRGELTLDERLEGHLPGCRMASLDTLAATSDLVVVIGGDGTLLHTARILAPYDVPIVGVNRGRLGFLADIAADEMLGSIDQILAGNFEEDPRFLLRTRLEDSTGEMASDNLALNDVVLHKWLTARMIEFELWINGRFVESQRSDGIIISTPTGSTAYALSGGGPLVYPDLDAILLVPICPHALSNRPIMVSGSSTIELRLCGRTTANDVRVTCDGQTTLEMAADSRLLISKAEHPARLLHPAGHDHFKVLRNKLDWGGRRQ
jgi:NAD+ kinase